jgi:hypothetical protein
VITCFNAGFIGAWGEWHSSDFGLDNTNSRRAILLKLLDAIPQSLMVTVRVNTYKRDVFDTDEPLDVDSAFSGSPRARVGAHNDCLGASETDWGTYRSNTIEWEKNYLNLDNRYVPQEGETCNPNEYSTCDPVVDDIIRMRWDLLNINYHGDVLQSWRDDGCFEEVQRRLGYRFQLIDADLPQTVAPEGVLSGSVRITNTGWGKCYNHRAVELVLRKAGEGEETVVRLDTDPRFWLLGDTATIEINEPLPASVSEGTYELFLSLPDTCERLYGRPEYSIRLANTGVWEESTGYNSLKHTVEVSGEATAILRSVYFAQRENAGSPGNAIIFTPTGCSVPNALTSGRAEVVIVNSGRTGVPWRRILVR